MLSGNRNTLKCVLEITKETTIVDFDIENSIRSVLGFEARKYKGGSKRYESENNVNILRVNSILVNCDVIASSRINGMPASVIYNFFPNVSPGEKIICQPKHIIYVPLTTHNEYHFIDDSVDYGRTKQFVGLTWRRANTDISYTKTSIKCCTVLCRW